MVRQAINRGWGVTTEQMRLLRDEMIDIATDGEAHVKARIDATRTVMMMVAQDRDADIRGPEPITIETETTSLEQQRAKLLGDIAAAGTVGRNP